MDQLPDLVRATKLDTSFSGTYTVHVQHDDSDNEEHARPVARTEVWEQKHMLGKGGCGEVWLQTCIDGNPKRKHRAVKALSTHGKHTTYQRELEAIAKFSQKRYAKYFVKLVGWYEKEATLCIAMEYFPLGDLQKYMDTHGAIPEADTRTVAFQILEGLDVLHQEAFAHRDIKPSNILIRTQPPQSWWVKISDFGISKRIIQNNATTTLRGTPAYMAPEIMDYVPSSKEKFDHQAADMWSLGEMLFRMLTTTAVFETFRSRLEYITQPNSFPSSRISEQGVSNNGLSLIKSLMQPTPKARLRSDQALAHQWFNACKTKHASLTSPVVPIQRFDFRGLDRISSSVQSPCDDPWATRSTRLSALGQPALDREAIIDNSHPKTQIEHLRLTDLDIFHLGQTIKGHTSTVQSVTFSGDTHLIVSASGDKTIRVWDPVTGRCQETIEVHKTSFLTSNISTTFLSDGRQIVSWSYDNIIKIWDLKARRCRQRLEGHTNLVFSIAFSSDNRQIVSGSLDNTIKIWDVRTGQCKQTLNGHGDRIASVAFSSDNRSIISGSWDGTLELWDATTGQYQHTLTGHTGRVNSTAFSSNNQQIVSGSFDRTIKIWDVRTSQCKQTLEGHYDWITSVAFSSGGRGIISGSFDKTIKIWDVATGQCRQTLTGHRRPVESVALSSDGRRIASGSSDNTIKVWNRKGLDAVTSMSGM